MRLSVVVVALLLGPLLQPAVSQVVAPATPAPPKGQPTAVDKNARDVAVASCEQMWDRATHMTKLEWARTCRRVQDRLEKIQLQ